MVNLSLKRKPKETPDTLERLRIEGGFQSIQGDQNLTHRQKDASGNIDDVVEDLKRKLSKSKEPRDIERILIEIKNWRLAKLVKGSATPWLRTGDNKSMSKRMAAWNQFLVKSMSDSDLEELVSMAALYVHDISHVNTDVTPAPVIVVQTPVTKGYGLDANETGTKTETA